jgi:hypothetical protein
MKRLLAALFLGLVVALVVASGVASADPPNDSATGAGELEQTLSDGTTIENKFAFSAYDEDAIGGDSSTARNGHFVYEETITLPTGSTTTLELKGSVSCVWVEGNRAFFNGPIEKSNEPRFEGRFAQFDVVDNDQPPGNGADPDQFVFETPPSFVSTCHVPLDIANFPITSGNIVVNDAQ